MKKPRLIATQAVDTLGEFASLVSRRPCTIHGWRPISVSTQPALAEMYGNEIPTSAIHWNQRACSSFRFRYSQAPIAATMNMTTPVIAITRIDQYATRMFG